MNGEQGSKLRLKKTLNKARKVCDIDFSKYFSHPSKESKGKMNFGFEFRKSGEMGLEGKRI